MAKNFLQGRGTVVTVAAPSGGVTSGQVVRIRSLVGVAMHDAAQGERVEIETFPGPIFTVPADNNLQIDVGDRVFWDDTNGWVDKTATSKTPVGIAVPLDTLADVAKATAGTSVRILFTGSAAIGS